MKITKQLEQDLINKKVKLINEEAERKAPSFLKGLKAEVDTLTQFDKLIHEETKLVRKAEAKREKVVKQKERYLKKLNAEVRSKGWSMYTIESSGWRTGYNYNRRSTKFTLVKPTVKVETIEPWQVRNALRYGEPAHPVLKRVMDAMLNMKIKANTKGDLAKAVRVFLGTKFI